ncbi:hypothetical protein [Brucella intermedia]|nr:hypothetical protein [Brucella intermedia]
MALPARLQRLLNEGRGKIVSAVKFEFGTGTYGFSQVRAASIMVT